MKQFANAFFFMIELKTSKSVYFASDFHLGVPDLPSSRARERRLVAWMNEVQANAGALFLLGDLFDTWMEYKHVVPKGFVRFQGALAQWADVGIPIYIFSGNHDVWMRDYFSDEFGAQVFHKEQLLKINDTLLQVGHGDGLGPKDYGYKFLKSVMRNPVAQWIYRRFHPNFGVGLASYFSQLGPKHQEENDDVFLGPEREWLVQHCEQMILKEPIEYFLFGHRHLPIEYTLSNQKSKYINIGDWMHFDSYAEFKDGTVTLKYYKS